MDWKSTMKKPEMLVLLGFGAAVILFAVLLLVFPITYAP